MDKSDLAGGRVQSKRLLLSLPSLMMASSSISLFLSSPFFTSSHLSSSSQSRFLIRCSSSEVPSIRFNKRGFLWGSITLGSLVLKEPFVSVAREVEVGSYLPPSPSDPSFVVFQATPKDTPALRAGNVEPYKFVLPPTWKQTRVANILSGNYCQPKCAEPWIEVKFEDEKQGKVQVVASPLIRLTNKPNATIEDIGTPEDLIASLGPFVTGNTFDSDELVETSTEKRGGLTYYNYVLETPFALTGTHNLAKATAKGNTVVLFVVSASEKQWSSAEKTLKTIVDSFEV